MLSKEIIKGIIVGIGIFISLIFILNTINTILFVSKGYVVQTIKSFEKQKEEIEILFSGPSDMQRAIMPNKFDKYRVFNFSPDAEDLTESYYKLKHYIKDMPNLKLIVLSTPLALFSSRWHMSNNDKRSRICKFYVYHYMTIQDVLELYKFEGIGVIKRKIFSLCPILFRPNMIRFWASMRRLVLHGSFFERKVVDGWSVKNRHKISIFDTKRRVFHEFGNSNVFDETFLLYFGKILKLCKRNNIKVVTLMCPVTDRYIRYAAQYVTKELFYKKVIDNPKYSKYIYKHLDFLEIFSNNYDLFEDADHLNPKGAAIFSKLVSEELSKIMLELYSQDKDHL